MLYKKYTFGIFRFPFENERLNLKRQKFCKLKQLAQTLILSIQLQISILTNFLVKLINKTDF